MKQIITKSFFFILLFSTVNCGFKVINETEKNDFSIQEIKTTGGKQTREFNYVDNIIDGLLFLNKKIKHSIDPINVGDYNMLYGSSSNDDLLPSYINGILTNLIVVPINHDYDAQICFEGGNTIFTKTVNPNSEIDLIHDEEDGDLDGIINYQINFGECIPLPPSPF